MARPASIVTGAARIGRKAAGLALSHFPDYGRARTEQEATALAWTGETAPRPARRTRETEGDKAAKAARAKLNRGLFGRLFG